MLRTLFCATVALGLLVAGSALAEDTKKAKKKKKGAQVKGTIVKVDAKEGTITLKVKKKKETEDKEFKVTDKTKVTILKDDVKVELKLDKVADLLKNDAFKEGAACTLMLDEDGKTAKSIVFGAAKKKKKKKDQ